MHPLWVILMLICLAPRREETVVRSLGPSVLLPCSQGDQSSQTYGYLPHSKHSSRAQLVKLLPTNLNTGLVDILI